MKEIVYLYKLDKEMLLEKESEIFRLLPKWRQEKAEKLKNEEARLQSISAGRVLMLAQEENPELNEFSISHSGEYVAVVVSDSRVGIDIEYKTDKDFKVTNRMFATEDIDYIGKEQKRFRDVWTVKEAFLKCTGEGISVPLSSFTTDYSYIEENGIGSIVSRGYELKGDYYLRTVRLDEDAYSLTLCSNNPNLTLDIRRVEVLV